MMVLLLFASCGSDDDGGGWNCGDTITDADGNVYATVKIGEQCWTVSNLNTSKLNDGTSIPNVTVQDDWFDLTTPGWSYYNNDAALGSVHGKLYNWYAIETAKLCPEGWHVPSISEWSVLVSELGGASVAGEAMKSISGWDNSPENATNSSGFSLMPSGNRDTWSSFLGIGVNAWMYSSSENVDDPTKVELLHVGVGPEASVMMTVKRDGLPCRCVKD